MNPNKDLCMALFFCLKTLFCPLKSGHEVSATAPSLWTIVEVEEVIPQ